MTERQQVGDTTFVLDGHLGGYVEGGDPNTYVPKVWRWLIDHYRVRHVLDVGCGDGLGSLAWFRGQGLGAVGIDGVDPVSPYVVKHDYSSGPLYRPRDGIEGVYDLAWSAEFVEHVEERHLPNILDTFRLARVVAMTHALPGQQGYHHVNCQPEAYWIGAMAAVGFVVDKRLTTVTRELAKLEPIHPDANYYARTGLVFRRYQ